jgi:hypothetical protein
MAASRNVPISAANKAKRPRICFFGEVRLDREPKDLETLLFDGLEGPPLYCPSFTTVPRDAEGSITSTEIKVGQRCSTGILELRNSWSHIIGDFICADLLFKVLS